MNPSPYWVLKILIPILMTVSVTAQSINAVNEGSRLRYDSFTEVYDLSWWGKTGRTYFVLQSTDDLESWDYLPIIEPGEEGVIEWGFSTNADRFFLRLRHTDLPTSDPWLDDFDGDTIGNQAELDQGTDPFVNEDLDNDGLPDDWERYYGLNPNSSTGDDGADGDPDGDGLTNAQEYASGRNPFEHENAPQTVPKAPENVEIHLHGDGSRTYYWTDVSDNEDYFFIKIRSRSGNMVTLVDNIPANSTSVFVSASTVEAALAQ